MKKNCKPMSRRILTLVVAVTLTFSLSSITFAEELSNNKGIKVNYVANSADVFYSTNADKQEIMDSYQLKWYEDPSRQLTKGEFYLAFLRMLQANRERLNLSKFEASEIPVDFSDAPDLSKSGKSELLICKALGMLQLGSHRDEYSVMDGKFNDIISKGEVIEILTNVNSMLEIPRVDPLPEFTEFDFDLDSPLLVEDILLFLDKEVGYYNTTREDVTRSIIETFKVTTTLVQIVPVPKEAKVLTDPSLMPWNAYKYPYIMDNVEKWVYEIPFENDGKQLFYNPKDLYQYRKDEIELVKEKISVYYGPIFNVDYSTINAEDVIYRLEGFNCGRLEDIEKNSIYEYVNYVKNHKIKITGKAEFLEPILYYDGWAYRARTKVTFQINESDTRENLLLFDFLNKQTNIYNNNTYSFYVDFSLLNIYGDTHIYNRLLPLKYSILNKETCGISFN